MPLRHLTVLDIANLGAAPQIAAFFGDFGARVIKVEPPGGDPLRKLVDQTGAALQWQIVNRNKQCVTLNLASSAGRDLFERLLAKSDLLVCALNATRMRRLRLDDVQLRPRHPRLVAVDLTTFGTSGPWADRPGSGTLAEAASGLASLTGPPDAPPTLSPVGLGDCVGVLQGIIAALLGLYGRDTGQAAGSFDVAMYEPLLGLLSQRIAATARDGVEPGRHGNRFPTMAPRNTYRAADGKWVALTAGTDEMVRRMFELMDRPELSGDPRFGDNRARLAHVDELDAIIQEWIGTRRAEDVVNAFAAAGVPLAAVDGLRDVVGNSHFRVRANFVNVDGVTVAAPSPQGSGTTGRIHHLGRTIGADNRAVYCQWLGLDEAELQKLQQQGIV
ncbi:MAG: CoA transferase [Deltaproteobacteria bacterium]|nr:CoA transferase [Deltaproteobacteria bacterium]